MSNQTDLKNEDKQRREALVLAINKLLRPLVKLMLYSKITFPQFSEVLKRVYVDVAEKEFKLENKSQTATRLSLLTGINRKYIKNLGNQGGKKEDAPVVISTGVQMVSLWLTEPRYRNDKNTPLPLPLKGKAGEPSFESLVQDIVKQDIRPRVILDEWLNLGVVSISEDNIITLINPAFIPSTKGDVEIAFFLGHTLSDHIAACSHNFRGKQPAFFERCVYYDGLGDDSIEVLEELANKRGMETLLELNELAMSLKTKDMAKTKKKHRFNLGLFVYHEPEESEK